MASDLRTRFTKVNKSIGVTERLSREALAEAYCSYVDHGQITFPLEVVPRLKKKKKSS